MAENNSILESQLIVHNFDELSANIPLNFSSIAEHASLINVPTTRINDFNSDDKELGSSLSETVVKQNVVDFDSDDKELGDTVSGIVVNLREKLNVKRRNLGRENELIDARRKPGDLREKLNFKRRNLGRENKSMGEIDARKNVGDLRAKLSFKRSSLSRKDEYVIEIDVMRKMGELREKLKGERCSLGQESENNNVIELYDELYAALESNERRLKEECRRLDCKEELIDSARQDFELKERDLELRLEGFDTQSKILGAKERKVKEYREMLDLKEKNLLGRLELKEKLVEKRLIALELKERDIEKRNGVIEAKEIEIDRRKESVAEKERDLELKEKEIDKQNEILGAIEEDLVGKLELKEKLVEEGLVEIELRKKNLLGSLELKEKLVEERLVAMELKENEIEKRFVAIKAKEESVMSEFCKAVEWKLTQMKVHYDAMEVEEKQEENRDLDDELRTKKISSDNEGLTLGEKVDGECGVGGRCEDLECTDNPWNLKQMDVRFDGVDVEAKQERVLNLDRDLRAKKLNGDNEGLIFNEKEDGECVGDHCEDLERMDNHANEVGFDIHLLGKEMDRHGVRSYMIRCVKEENLLHAKIFDALIFASEPTKRVLDISKSFFETDLDESDSDFFKISCVHLLEQLIKLSPSITPDVEREARDYADVWKKRLDYKTSGHPVNHFGFLHFVAAYKLTRFHGWKKLLHIFKSSYFAAKRFPPQKNVDLCRALGLTDKLPGFVRSLIEKRKHMEAIKCISLFKMECDFPPVPLIEAYLEFRKQKVGELIKEAGLEGKEVFPEFMELTHLRLALSYIQSLGIPSVFPTDSLSSRITQLKKKIHAKRKTTESSRKRQAVPVESSEQLQKRPRM